MSEVKIAYEIEINQPNLPEGEPIQVPGLGTFENGQTYDVTEEEGNSYRAFHSYQEPIIGENNEVLGANTLPGRDLAEAFEGAYGITVTKTDKTIQVDDEEEAFTPAPDNDPAQPQLSFDPGSDTAPGTQEGSDQ